MPDDIDARAFGQMEADVRNMREQMTYLSRCFEKLSGQVDEVHELIAKAQGGWKIVPMLGSILVALAGAGAWIFAQIKGH